MVALLLAVVNEFLSTPSARRATARRPAAAPAGQISIHALREEGDMDGFFGNLVCKDFYPRPPRGGRPSGAGWSRGQSQFLSTPSARRAT